MKVHDLQMLLMKPYEVTYKMENGTLTAVYEPLYSGHHLGNEIFYLQRGGLI